MTAINRFDQAEILEAPREIPADLRSAYTLGGSIQVADWYINAVQPPSSAKVFQASEIQELIAKAHRRENNYYGETDRYLFEALDHFAIKNLDCVVMGTQVPWYESISLAFGARSCTVIEYWRLHFEHPQIEALTPDEYDRNPVQFDAAFSISSFEHDGLGRYGDPLNPFGDIEAMQKMKTIVKKNGLLFLAVPVAKDKLVWNAHRIYGRLRLPLLLNGWQILAAVGFSEELFDLDTGKDGPYQPVFVLKNI